MSVQRLELGRFFALDIEFRWRSAVQWDEELLEESAESVVLAAKQLIRACPGGLTAVTLKTHAACDAMVELVSDVALALDAKTGMVARVSRNRWASSMSGMGDGRIVAEVWRLVALEKEQGSSGEELPADEPIGGPRRFVAFSVEDAIGRLLRRYRLEGQPGVTREVVDDRAVFRFETKSGEYAINVVRPSDERPRGYLGGYAPGRDMADGDLTLGTWTKILSDIVAYEMLEDLDEG